MSRFERAAAQLGVELEVRRFPEGTRTATDAARAVGCDVGQIVKSLVFTRDGEPVLVLASGANRVDEARLGLSRADADLVRAATGYAIGGVPPFGHARELETVADPDLLAFDVVWAAAGAPDAVFAIDPRRLVELTRARVEPVAPAG
jgi:prolyl-tRNA editing enzyme YbaK/EbsC (Cys-tRNA(Pro) deacylase)